MTWKNKFTAIQGRAQAAGAVLCKLTPTPGTRSPSGGVCTRAAPHPCVTGLPAVHVLSSNFGEFPQNHSRETYQIPDMVWLPPGLLGRITFLAPVSTHLWRSPRNPCSYSVPGFYYTSAELPSPVATVAPAWWALGC